MAFQSTRASAVVFTGKRDVAIREERVEPPAGDELLVDTTLSAISPGTELLLYRDEIPQSLPADLSISSLEGDLSYPIKYGYATVGEVLATGPDVPNSWRGKRVFAFHPHQSQFTVPVEDAVAVGDADTADAAMLPAVETATNLLLDGTPRLGERVVLFGAGPIGLCTTRLLAEFPLDSLIVIEPIEKRREIARSFGADEAVDPAKIGDIDPEADLVYELSGQPDALEDALDVVGYDGRVVVGSWYGSKRSPLPLGERFHRDRIDIVSSQVSTLAPELRGRWSRDRRRAQALARVRQIDFDPLVTDRLPVEDARQAYERLDREPETTVQVLLTYDNHHPTRDTE